MTPAHDMTEAQFLEALERHGIQPLGGALGSVLGYCDLGHGVHESRLNGGSLRRDQLAYLLGCKREADAHFAEHYDAMEVAQAFDALTRPLSQAARS